MSVKSQVLEPTLVARRANLALSVARALEGPSSGALAWKKRRGRGKVGGGGGGGGWTEEAVLMDNQCSLEGGLLCETSGPLPVDS